MRPCRSLHFTVQPKDADWYQAEAATFQILGSGQKLEGVCHRVDLGRQNVQLQVGERLDGGGSWHACCPHLAAHGAPKNGTRQCFTPLTTHTEGAGGSYVKLPESPA